MSPFVGIRNRGRLTNECSKESALRVTKGRVNVFPCGRLVWQQPARSFPAIEVMDCLEHDHVDSFVSKHAIVAVNAAVSILRKVDG
jgi:hypothetical protein